MMKRSMEPVVRDGSSHRMNRRAMLTQGLRVGAGLLAAQALPGVLRAESKDDPKDILGKKSLKAQAAARGLSMGCAVDTRLLRSDEAYRTTLAQQFNMVVGENCMKFGPLRPKVEDYFFDDSDALVKFAEEHGMKVRGHNFVWHEQLPKWFAGTVTKETARKVMTDHIRTVGGRYKGKIHSWDVVNEAIWIKDGRPDGLRSSSPWFDLLGPEYLAIAFKTAREVDPNALLTYNDYGIEYDTEEDNAKRAAVLALLRRLKADGVPVDALGVQAHIHTGKTATDKASFEKGAEELRRGAHELGLQLFITELDVKDDPIEADDTASRDRIVAQMYRDYLGAMLKGPEVKAVLTWGISDAHTWVNGPRFRPAHPTRTQRPLPFDGDYKPTEAFFAIRESLRESKRR